MSFFTLFGFIFLMTQYFQFVRGYGPLSTGVRLLPVALSVGAGSVAGTQLAVRAGTKLIVTTGLVAMAAFYGWVAATTSATLSYGIIAAQMVLYGLGMGLTSAPATESIMGAISRRKAGVGSAVNDSTRLVGGTLGVAVIGSVYASVYGSRLDRHHARGRARPGRGDRPPVRRRGVRWPPARSPPSATRSSGRHCSTPPPTHSCAASPSAPSSPAPSPPQGPSWPSCSCPPSPQARRPVKPKQPQARTKPRPKRTPSQ